MSVLNPIVDQWDGENRRIYLKQGVVNYYPIEDIYHEYRYARRTDEELRKYEPLLRAEGNVAKGAGAFTPRYVVLLNGTKIIPYNESAQINQLGDMITDNPDVDPSLYDISGLTVAKPIFIKPSEAETIQLNSEAIVYSSFQGAVWYDVNSPYSDKGSASRPNGNTERPVNSIPLAVQIAKERGFIKIELRSDCMLTAGDDIRGMIIHGVNSILTHVFVEDSAETIKCEFKNVHITGVLDGQSSLIDCEIGNLNYINGEMHHCQLNETITLGGGTSAILCDCYSGVPGTDTPTINMGGSGQSLALRDYHGGIKITNKTGIEPISLDISSGQVKLGADVTNGIIVCRGIGRITENLSSGATIIDQMVNDVNFSNSNWNTLLSEHQIEGSAGKALSTASSGGVDLQLLANAVWDEPLTGASHNVPTSSGRRLRQLSAPIILEGFAISSTINSITFDGEASTVTGSYDPCLISIVSGTGAGQSRVILEYDGNTKTAIVDRNWRINPDSSSEYIIVSSEGREHVNEGRAQAGTLNTITLNQNASEYDDVYLGQVVFIRSGTAEDQAKRIIAYNGTTKVATVESNWNEIPDNTSGYVMLPTAVMTPECLRNAVWNATSANYLQDGSTGKALSTASSGGVDYEVLADAVWDAPTSKYITPNTMGSELKTLMDIQAGNWEIQETMMIFYKRDGTELFRYSLLDQNGLPSNKDVFKRLKL